MPPRFIEVTCPSCFRRFEVAAPPPEELPAEFDYDCEICCRPMVIFVDGNGDEIRAEARGINKEAAASYTEVNLRQRKP